MTHTDHAYDALLDEIATLPFDDRLGVYDKPSTVIHESLTRGLVSARTVALTLRRDRTDRQDGAPTPQAPSCPVHPERETTRPAGTPSGS